MKRIAGNPILFYSFWLALAIIQSYYTTLFDDEAYYFMFSRHLDAGYFDHPPAIAFIIKLGTLLWGNKHEFAVRFGSILLNTGTLILLQKTSRPKEFWHFSLPAASLLFLQTGFIASPDSPLLFFAALYFFSLQFYLEQDKSTWIIMLSISIAGMLYSKYHGILPVFFTLIAYPALLKRKSLYLIAGIVVMLILPHIVWQINHYFVSIQYHLTERSLNPYSLANTLEYLPGALLVPAGFLTPLLLFRILKTKTLSCFQQICRLNVYGVLIFFLIMTFKGRVELNWLCICIPAIVPLMVFNFSHQPFKIHIPEIALAAGSVMVILMLRLYITIGYDMGLPALMNKSDPKFYTWLSNQSGDLPVVFMNAYEKASMYSFYTGKEAYSLSNVLGRKSDYTLQTEKQLMGKNVFVILNFKTERFDSLCYLQTCFQYNKQINFQSYSFLRFEPETHLNQLPVNQNIVLPARLLNPQNIEFSLEANPNLPSYFSYQFFRDNVMVVNERTSMQLHTDDVNKVLLLPVHTPKEKGRYLLNLSITTGWMPPTLNSRQISVEIN